MKTTFNNNQLHEARTQRETDGTILTKLKQGTREQHEALEALVDILNSTFELKDYRHMLSTFYQFYAAIEPKIASSGLTHDDIDLVERQKTKLLEKDLLAVGLADVSIKPWTDLPNLESPARAFGSLYVLEGATLGGQVISRHLRQRLAITPDTGGAFFNSYGEQVGPMWKKFGAAIVNFTERQGGEDEIVASAKATFDSFGKCFSENRADKAQTLS